MIDFIGFLTALVTVSPFLLGVAIRMQIKSQRDHDADRVTYSIIFPREFKAEKAEAFLRTIGGSLKTKSIARLRGVPTIVFETIASDNGIEHRLHVPSALSDYIPGQIEVAFPGADVTPVDLEPLEWTDGVQLSMSDPGRMLRIKDATNYSTSILKAIQTDYPGETAMVQWVITGSNGKKVPSNSQTSSKVSLFDALVYGTQDKSEKPVDEKLQEQTFNAVGRVVSIGKNPKRSRALISDVVRAIKAGNGENKFRDKDIKPKSLYDDVNRGTMPPLVDVQLTVPELIPLISWPLGDPQIPGLKQGAARRFHAVEAIPRTGGRLIGHSNIPNRNRPISMSHEDSVLHTFIGGKTGRGKTVQMANQAYADMKAGHGVIVLDASASRSDETMFSRTLNYVPPERVNDVIVLDISGDRRNPVGFNLLDQGLGDGAIDHFVGIFETLYPSIATQTVFRDMLTHGLSTLIEYGGLTFIDLAILISPRTDAERRWAQHVRRSTNNPALIDFWARVEDGKGNVLPSEAKPLHNKIWQLTTRSEIHNIIGQTHSAVQIRDVLANNKILLVSLSSLPSQTAELIASLITGTLWSIAQSMKPAKANFLYSDEFQVSAKVQGGFDDMLARSRKHNLGVTLATQYIERLDPDLKTAIINNTGTRIIYETSAAEARIWIPEFGGHQLVRDTDFTGIRKHEAIAKVATAVGTSEPVTLKALAPLPATGVADEVLATSRLIYGRPLEVVQKEIADRRTVEPKRDDPPKPFGRSPYAPKS